MKRVSEKTRSEYLRFAEAISLETTPWHLSEIARQFGLQLQPASSSDIEKQCPKQERNIRKIGIWEERSNGEGLFVRTDNPDWPRWANMECIPPKGHRKRVVLLGESVARGYFYDPYFNPASALETIFSRVGADHVEIIDLAKTGISLEELLEVMKESEALAPDAYVVFAGNNWSGFADLSTSVSARVAEIIRSGGDVEQVKSCHAAHVEERVRYAMKSMADVGRAIAVPVVFILPEFNLLDWHHEGSDQLPFLSSDETASWESAYVEARNALEDKRFETATSHAQRMLELDQGTTSKGYEILAHCALTRGDIPEARQLLEMGRDAGLFLPWTRTPRCSSTVQTVVRLETQSSGFFLVDLPRVFSALSSGGLPDRNLFHDYCHMTSAGIRIAMTSTAAVLLPLLSGKHLDVSAMMHADWRIEPQVEAEAFLLSAIHNAWGGQREEVIRYQCEQGLDRTPRASETFFRLLDSHLHALPYAMSKSFAPFWENKGPVAKYFFQLKLKPEKELLPSLVSVLADVLESRMPEIRQFVESRLQEHQGLRKNSLNMLSLSNSCISSLDVMKYWQYDEIIYCATSPHSNFSLVTDGTCCVQLTITLRIPKGQKLRDTDIISLQCNNSIVFSCTPSHSWKTHEVRVPLGATVRGLNRICINWPKPYWTREERLQRMLAQLERGRAPKLTSGYGEIHSFRASAVQSSGNDAELIHHAL
jgi:hypothetical protein